MLSPDQTPNYDTYNAEPSSHTEVIDLLHKIGHTSTEQLVKLKDALVEQGNSKELAALIAQDTEPGAVYI